MATLATPPTSLPDIEIDWNLGADSDFASEEPTIETAPVLSTWDIQVAAPESLDLIKDELAILADAGIVTSDKDLFYAPGTALAESGMEALQAYDRAFKELPPPATAVADFHATIEAEGRIDTTRDLADHRVNVGGRLAHVSLIADNEAGLDIGRTAWRQLTEIAKSPNVNQGLAGRQHANRRIRTRSNENGKGREAFGIVSTDPQRGYAVFDGPTVADHMLAGLKSAGMLSGAKMTINYDRESTRYDVRAVIQAPVDVPSFAGVGRVHQMFARVTGGDDGMSSVKGGLGAIRVRCLNASLVECMGAEWTKIHRGDVSDIRALVAQMTSHFGDAARSLQEVWSRAAGYHYLDTDGGALSVSEALARLIAHGHVPTGGEQPEVALDRYMAAWRAEDSPTTAAGILMAVQRAAHEGSWSSRWAQPDIEEAASHLLYQPVWQLAEVEG